MISFLKSITFAIAILTPGLSALATQFDLGKNGDLFIDVPDSWRVTTRLVEGTGYEFTFTSANGASTKGHFSLIALPSKRPIDRQQLDRDLTTLCQQRFVAASVEKKVTLQPYKLRQGYGAYSVFTDASLVDQPPKPDDFKVIAPGLLQPTEKILIVATLFTDDPAGAEFAALRKMTESVRITPPVKP
jgi:hypothetical protein